jgi:hypothetical protein
MQQLNQGGAGGVMLMPLQLQLRPTPWGEIADVVTRCFMITAAAAAATYDDDAAAAAAASHTLQ